MTRKTSNHRRRKPTQSRSQDTVNCILEATAHILRAEGFAKATTNRIAERAGVSIGSLYQYFPNKSALLLALTSQHISEMQTLITQRLHDTSDLPLQEAIAALVDAMLEVHSIDPKLHAELSDIAPQLLSREQTQQLENVYIQLITSYLESRKNEISCKECEVAAFILVHSLEALTHRTVNHPAILARKDVLRADLITMIHLYLTHA